MSDVTPFPWARVMQFAFGQLRLTPEAFWSMTMHELSHAMAPHQGSAVAAISRQKLDQLIRQYPDN